jgi:hypothetical protein
MDRTAPVPHEQTAGRIGDDIARRKDAVLKRHACQPSHSASDFPSYPVSRLIRRTNVKKTMNLVVLSLLVAAMALPLIE